MSRSLSLIAGTVVFLLHFTITISTYICPFHSVCGSDNHTLTSGWSDLETPMIAGLVPIRYYST